MELSEELIAKAKGTKTPEELAALAKESSIDLTEEEAKAYFEQLHPKTGELSDDELDNVAGGGCHNGGRLVVSAMNYCDEWRCKDDGSMSYLNVLFVECNTCHRQAFCYSCSYCTYEKGLWLCNRKPE